MPVAVFSVGCVFGTEKFNWGARREEVARVCAWIHAACKCGHGSWVPGLPAQGTRARRLPAHSRRPTAGTLGNMVLVTIGVAIASYGEAAADTGPVAWAALPIPPRPPSPSLATTPGELNFNIVGVMFQLSAIVSESIRLVLVQLLLQVCGGVGGRGDRPVTMLLLLCQAASPACQFTSLNALPCTTHPRAAVAWAQAQPHHHALLCRALLLWFSAAPVCLLGGEQAGQRRKCRD